MGDSYLPTVTGDVLISTANPFTGTLSSSNYYVNGTTPANLNPGPGDWVYCLFWDPTETNYTFSAPSNIQELNFVLVGGGSSGSYTSNSDRASTNYSSYPASFLQGGSAGAVAAGTIDTYLAITTNTSEFYVTNVSGNINSNNWVYYNNNILGLVSNFSNNNLVALTQNSLQNVFAGVELQFFQILGSAEYIEYFGDANNTITVSTWAFNSSELQTGALVFTFPPSNNNLVGTVSAVGTDSAGAFEITLDNFDASNLATSNGIPPTLVFYNPSATATASESSTIFPLNISVGSGGSSSSTSSGSSSIISFDTAINGVLTCTGGQFGIGCSYSSNILLSSLQSSNTYSNFGLGGLTNLGNNENYINGSGGFSVNFADSSSYAIGGGGGGGLLFNGTKGVQLYSNGGGNGGYTSDSCANGGPSDDACSGGGGGGDNSIPNNSILINYLNQAGSVSSNGGGGGGGGIGGGGGGGGAMWNPGKSTGMDGYINPSINPTSSSGNGGNGMALIYYQIPGTSTATLVSKQGHVLKATYEDVESEAKGASTTSTILTLGDPRFPNKPWFDPSTGDFYQSATQAGATRDLKSYKGREGASNRFQGLGTRETTVNGKTRLLFEPGAFATHFQELTSPGYFDQTLNTRVQGINPTGLIPYLVEALNEQNNTVEQHKKTLATQQQAIVKQRKRMNKQQNALKQQYQLLAALLGKRR